MENNSRFESCSCQSNPPCSFCTYTFICDCCGNREDADDMLEADLGFVCLTCQENNEVKIIHSGVDTRPDLLNHFEYDVFISGKLSVRITNIRYKKPEPSAQFENRPIYSALGEGIER